MTALNLDLAPVMLKERVNHTLQVRTNQPFSRGMGKGWGICEGTPPRVKEVLRDCIRFLEGDQLGFAGEEETMYQPVKNCGMRYRSTYILSG
jgi:hypothetical protein